MPNSVYATPAQVDEKVQAALNRGISASAKGFKTFTNPAAADAFFTATPPAEDTLFIYTDPAESKADFYRRASDNTTQVLREASLTTSDVSQSGPEENSNELATSGQLYNLNKNLSDKFLRIKVTSEIDINSEIDYGFSSGNLGRVRTWYFGKSTKTIDRIGVYWYKPLSSGMFTDGTSVQVFVERGGVITELLTKETSASDMQKYVTDGIVGGFSNYEQLIDLDTSWNLDAGDVLMIVQVTLASADKFKAIFLDVPATETEGEWDLNDNYYRIWSTGFYPNPEDGSATPNYASYSEPRNTVINFYSTEQEEIDLAEFKQEFDDSQVSSNKEDISALVNTPPYVFDIENNSNNIYTRSYLQKMYPESFVKEARDVSVNNYRAMDLFKRGFNSNVKQDFEGEEINITGESIQEVNETYTLKRTQVSNAKGKPVRMIVLSSSVTAQDVADIDGTRRGGWNWVSYLKQISMQDNIDFGDDDIDVLTMGITNGRSSNNEFEYKENTYTIRSFSEGRSSWAAAMYLRHAIPTQDGLSSSSVDKLSYPDLWTSLGLTSEIGAWSNTSINRELLRSTPHGKYSHDYSEGLWEWAKLKLGISNSDTYTGNATQMQNIDDALSDLYSNPVNPFFDLATAQSTLEYAFNIQTYFDRYKTLDTDGITRLVVGSTAGSLVSDSFNHDLTVNPTHFVLFTGGNDLQFTSNTGLIADDIETICSIVKAYDSNIIIGCAAYRSLGVYNPEKWLDLGIIESRTQMSSGYVNLNNTLQSRHSGFNTDMTYVPVYYLMNPLIDRFAKYGIDLTDINAKRVIFEGDESANVHYGETGQIAVAVQWLSWLYWSL